MSNAHIWPGIVLRERSSVMMYFQLWFLLVFVSDVCYSEDKVQIIITRGNDTILNATSWSNSTESSRPLYEPYVYGTISVAVISLLSVAGVIFIPFIKRKLIYESVMLLFMALAVGTLASDAFLHLIPETLALEEADAEGDETGRKASYLGKMVAVVGVLYALYLLELLATVFSKLAAMRSVGQRSKSTEAGIRMEPVPVTEQEHHHSHTPVLSSDSTICGMKSVAFVVVVSDAMHNFTDGLAVGAAFARSTAAGVAVTIAVICHEIPHEIGDFAILLNTGMAWKRALFLNFASALTCFAGLYPGILAGQQEELAQWIFAGVAAGFLYVSLAYMLRELLNFSKVPLLLSVVLQNLGLWIGFAVIFLLAIYEEQLNNFA